VQDKIDCNKINKIREERNANSIYIGLVTSRAYVQSLSNPLEIFTNFVKILFTTSKHQGNPFPLCSGNSQFKRQTTSWLQLTFWDEQKDFALLEWIIQFDVHGWTLNIFASVCPRVVERAFDDEVLLEYLSLTFWSQTHIYIGPSCLFKMVWRDVSFQKLFLKFFTGNQLQVSSNRLHSYILKGHVFSNWISRVPLLVIDYTFKIQISNPFKKLICKLVFW